MFDYHYYCVACVERVWDYWLGRARVRTEAGTALRRRSDISRHGGDGRPRESDRSRANRVKVRKTD